ncbi:hypothetical protein H5410_024630 [Solanum commersonii]|uniref:TTF-type domain-containing protein n=1 Tax=Solanum commersonii TaxID=4109 RepID=A0A9J5ZMH1_SOLCO|nr:hypothetical protein H5410_024630 [Solanum commersonii]
MDKCVTRSKIGHPSSSSTHSSTASTIAPKIQRKTFISDVDLESLEADPGIRKAIAEYNPNRRDDIRRYYILKKPCQPKDHKFPKTKFGKEMRQFFPDWFNDRKWLEYSITKDVAFCLCCYLFKNECESLRDVVDVAFTKTDFRARNKAIERFRAYVGDINSIHNKCFNKMLDLMNQSQLIHTSFDKKFKKKKSESWRRLSASVNVTRFLLKLGLSFCGHDESRSSSNRGFFIELLQWYRDINEDVGSIILEKAPKNEMMYSPSIQKDIIDSCAKETIKVILEDLDGDYFGILVDESKDVSHKEQMSLVLKYVNKEGEVIERFVDHSLSPSQIRGQGYDGASNMQGHLNSLKTLILNETPSAYCIHCFAHQLQLTLVVALAKKHSNCRDLLRKHQAEQLKELLISGEVHTGRRSNQERGLQRPVIHVLKFTECECPNYTDRLLAKTLVDMIKKFEFVSMLHLVWKVLTMTNELSSSLQMMNQDIVNAMGFLALTKQRLQNMRDNKSESLMDNFMLVVLTKRFFNLKGISDLAKVLVKLDLHQTGPLVYLLIKLTLILSVAIVSVK